MSNQYNNNIKSLPLKRTCLGVMAYVSQNKNEFMFFSLINFILLCLFSSFVGSISGQLFLPWICVYYAFWFSFFRFYYSRRPYLFTKKIFGTLVPSTKILFLVFFLTLLVILLPFLPLFIGYNEEYAFFIDKYMSSIQTLGQNTADGKQNIFPLIVLYSIFLMLSPIIFIRPMFAWISSLIGRSGSIRNAFNNTHGNYFKFLILSVIFEMPLSIVEIVFERYQLNEHIMWLVISPLIILGNISIAKAYDFFFLTPDNA